MSLDTGGQPAPEAPAREPNPATPVVEDAPEPETPDVESAPQDDEPDEVIDYEDGGKKYKVPKALKGHLLRQSDYSRQMNELGASRKEAEARLEAATAWRQTEEAHQRNLGQLHNVEDQLKAFDKVDWTAWLSHPNPNERQRAMIAQAQRAELDRKRSALRDTIKEGQQKHETEVERRTAERLQRTRDFATKELPGWSDKREQEVIDLIQVLPKETQTALLRHMDPELLKVLDLAIDGKTGRAARAAAEKAAKAVEASNVTPLETVGQRTAKPAPSRRGPPEGMDDYIKWRKAGGGTKRA